MLTLQTSLLLLLLLLSLLSSLYLYLRMKYNFWKDLGVAYKPPRFFFGSIKDLILGKVHMAVEFDRIYKSFPEERYVGFFQFFRPILMMRDPRLIEHVLAKDFHLFHSRGIVFDERLDPLEGHVLNLDGKRWRMVRTKLSPTFSSGKLKQMDRLIEECVKDLDDQLLSVCAANGKSNVEIREIMARYTTDVIGRCAFGLNFNSLKDPNSEYRKMGRRLATPTKLDVVKVFARMMHPTILIRLGIKFTAKPIEQFFTNLFRSTMTYRKRHNVQRNDFMQLMINLYDREMSGKQQAEENDEPIDEEIQFTENLFPANMYIFYLGGFDTSATTLSYLYYELALNPDVQNKLREHVNQVIDEHGDVVNYDVLQHMKYADMVISETLRKYSPAVVIGRSAATDYQIPGTSIVIPAGMRVKIPINSIHYDSKYYPEPEKFIPERFSPEYIRPSYTYLPFGGGPRICMGLRFSRLEMKFCLTHIIPKYRFEVCSETVVPVRLKPRALICTPDHEITLSITKL